MSFYKEQLEIHTTALARVKQQLFASSMLRLALFVLASIAVYFGFSFVKIVLLIVVATIILFLILVSRHTDLQHKRDTIKALIQINETELQVLERKYHHLPEGNQFKDDSHYFSQDIDLFGKGSFFQYSNRTALEQGTVILANAFTANSITGIQAKQAAIKELSAMPKWRQEFTAIASLVNTETSYKKILVWLKNYTPFIPKLMQWLPNVFSVLSLAVLAAAIFNVIPLSVVGVWIAIGFLITGKYIKRVTTLAHHTTKVQSTFQQYQQLMLLVEETAFESTLLKNQKSKIISEHFKISGVLKEFSRILSAVDQRNNIIIAFLGNAFFLWDVRQVYRLEAWINAHHTKVGQWFETIAFFDAYNSLGNFCFNHPDYSFPSITNNTCILQATNAGHPLLDPKKMVLNDITINKEEFFIITGANMAGKSTFLRTVSLQLVMANIGLPVCAEKVTYSPIKLVTSMRTTDSLTDDESYFYSELKRLKFVVDQIQDESYFIVLDEILKGTNSTDKAIGSRKFVEKLVGSKSTGIIATHDLSLCEVAKALPQVQNYYFDAEIKADELFFDYKFKAGICQNMNASFLLKKMNIV